MVWFLVSTPTTINGVTCKARIGVTLVGILLGLGAALWMVRFIGSMLYGLGGADPLTAVCATLLLLTVSIIAAVVPARLASQIDPIRALRHE